jgi:hypothetical protein
MAASAPMIVYVGSKKPKPGKRPRTIVRAGK